MGRTEMTRDVIEINWLKKETYREKSFFLLLILLMLIWLRSSISCQESFPCFSFRCSQDPTTLGDFQTTIIASLVI